MSRHSQFSANREPFRYSHAIQLLRSTPTGLFSFLNPTHAHFKHRELAPQATTAEDTSGRAASEQKDGRQLHNISFLWRSRDNRKGRHALVVYDDTSTGIQSDTTTVPAKTQTMYAVSSVLKKMFTTFPYWDISYLVGLVFTIGSTVWILNAFFVWLPSAAPGTEFKNEIYWGGGLTAFIGAILFFETGSILLIMEATNENTAGCFGYAVEELFYDREVKSSHRRFRPDTLKNCHHHHPNRHNLVGMGSNNGSDELQKYIGLSSASKWHWRLLPTWADFRSHYSHELGFLAGLAQLFGATIFGISGFTALPGIYNHLHPQHVTNLAYWIPQVVGGSGFIVSGTLYMLETQTKWYKPELTVLGWWIAAWNLVGALGFTLCGALGMAYNNTGAQYQAGLATFWGSWAFLIGSLLQLYESLDKNPVVHENSKSVASDAESLSHDANADSGVILQ